MRAFNCLVAALSLLVSASYYTAAATPASPMSPSLDVACDPDARGRHLQELQEAAIADYAHLLYELEDPRAAFDRYIPGEFTQHVATSTTPGRQGTLDFLVPFFANSQLSFTNIRTFAGGGHGFVHRRLDINGGVAGGQGGTSFAAVNILKFQGTCLVEHWEVNQRIMGTEPNPIGWF